MEANSKHWKSTNVKGVSVSADGLYRGKFRLRRKGNVMTPAFASSEEAEAALQSMKQQHFAAKAATENNKNAAAQSNLGKRSRGTESDDVRKPTAGGWHPGPSVYPHHVAASGPGVHHPAARQLTPGGWQLNKQLAGPQGLAQYPGGHGITQIGYHSQSSSGLRVPNGCDAGVAGCCNQLPGMPTRSGHDLQQVSSVNGPHNSLAARLAHVHGQQPQPQLVAAQRSRHHASESVPQPHFVQSVQAPNGDGPGAARSNIHLSGSGLLAPFGASVGPASYQQAHLQSQHTLWQAQHRQVGDFCGHHGTTAGLILGQPQLVAQGTISGHTSSVGTAQQYNPAGWEAQHSGPPAAQGQLNPMASVSPCPRNISSAEAQTYPLTLLSQNPPIRSGFVAAAAETAPTKQTQVRGHARQTSQEPMSHGQQQVYQQLPPPPQASLPQALDPAQLSVQQQLQLNLQWQPSDNQAAGQPRQQINHAAAAAAQQFQCALRLDPGLAGAGYSAWAGNLPIAANGKSATDQRFPALPAGNDSGTARQPYSTAAMQQAAAQASQQHLPACGDVTPAVLNGPTSAQLHITAHQHNLAGWGPQQPGPQAAQATVIPGPAADCSTPSYIGDATPSAATNRMAPQMLAPGPFAGTGAAAAAAVAAAPGDATLIDSNDADCLGLPDLLLKAPHSRRSAAAAAAGGAAAAAAGNSDVRDVGLVRASLLDSTRSSGKPQQNQPAAVAAAVVQGPPMPSAATTRAANAATGIGSSRPHRQAVIVESDINQGDRRAPCQIAAASAASPGAATAAPAPAAADDGSNMVVADQLRTPDGTLDVADVVPLLQRRLAAKAAQITKLQLEKQQLQQDVAAAAQARADRRKAECERRHQETQLLRQQQLEAPVATAAGGLAARMQPQQQMLMM